MLIFEYVYAKDNGLNHFDDRRRYYLFLVARLGTAAKVGDVFMDEDDEYIMVIKKWR